MTKIWRKGITYDEVREYLDYKNGFLYWKKIRKYNSKKIGDLAGRLNVNGRRDLGLNNCVYYASRVIFLWHYGWLPDYVDHEDGGVANDKIENLRAASCGQNQTNRIKCNRNGTRTSIYKGVCYTLHKKPYGTYRYWEAALTVDGKSIRLGTFKTEQVAALAYNREAVRHHKEFAKLNIIQL